MSDKGYVYILTNPSFPQYVKIGYADDVERRLKELNRSECIPFSFRVYATYETSARLTDMKIHNVIDRLNPSLRSIEVVNGKKRVREFYAMSPEDALSILEAIAEMNDLGGNVKKWPMSEEDKKALELSEEIEDEGREKRSPFSFTMIGVQAGEKIYSLEKPEIECIVCDDLKHVEYKGEVYSLSTLARDILEWKHRPTGPRHFTYKGEILDDIRIRNEENKRK